MENINKPSTSIKNWAVDDRPREKLLIKGAAVLSDSELLALLINNGNKEKSAVEIAKDVLQLGGYNLNELGKLSLKELQKVKRIGIDYSFGNQEKMLFYHLDIKHLKHRLTCLQTHLLKTKLPLTLRNILVVPIYLLTTIQLAINTTRPRYVISTY